MNIFRSFFNLFSSDLAIDLGTANTLVYLRGKGVILSEPSVVAVRLKDGRNGKILAVGSKAQEMEGKTPADIAAIRPMKDGVIADFDITQSMLRHFIRKTHHRRIFKPRIIVAVPSGITQVEKKAVREAAEQAGASEVYLIEEPMAAALGAGLPVTEPAANMIVDIGGGTTEVAIISLAGIVYSKSVRIGGDKMNEAIGLYIRKKYNLFIGVRTAENIKHEIGTAYPSGEVETVEVKGLHTVTALPMAVPIDSEEIRKSLKEQLDTIINTVKSALEQIPPELAADIVTRGIVLTGGGALLRHLDALLREETQLPIHIADNPLMTVAIGSGKALESLDILKEIVLK
ncbi:MAG: rod shape-determining protein [Deltaproteobacteria bacterium]|jgi:rod shape-determining protein MreB|nr:rod shape-determining protein [Deltaproteobacteria bacterium]MDR1309224.1 rod shape-determining protein [Deltaproteobacteria bacterium]